MKKLIIFLWILLIGFPAFAQEKPSIKVYIDVSGDSSILKQAESYIKGKLKSLGDITIVSKKDADVGLQAVVIEGRITSGHKIGFMCACAIIIPVSGYDHLVRMTLYTGRDLKKMCQDIVTEFDTGHLEIIRESGQRNHEPPGGQIFIIH